MERRNGQNTAIVRPEIREKKNGEKEAKKKIILIHKILMENIIDVVMRRLPSKSKVST